jgi:hypothetical protein
MGKREVWLTACADYGVGPGLVGLRSEKLHVRSVTRRTEGWVGLSKDGQLLLLALIEDYCLLLSLFHHDSHN